MKTRGNVGWINVDPRVEDVKIFMTGEVSSKEFVPKWYSSGVVAVRVEPFFFSFQCYMKGMGTSWFSVRGRACSRFSWRFEALNTVNGFQYPRKVNLTWKIKDTAVDSKDFEIMTDRYFLWLSHSFNVGIDWNTWC